MPTHNQMFGYRLEKEQEKTDNIEDYLAGYGQKY